MVEWRSTRHDQHHRRHYNEHN